MNELATVPLDGFMQTTAVCVAGLVAFSVCFVAIFDSKTVRDLRERAGRAFPGRMA